MNIEKIKSILLFAFAGIAIIMIVMIGINESRYTLSAAQEESVLSLLERSGISFQAEMTRDFSPMRPILLDTTAPNTEEIAVRFFGDNSFVAEEQAGHRILSLEGRRRQLIYSMADNIIVLDIPGGLANPDFLAAGAQGAVGLAVDYIEAIFGMPDSLEFVSNILNFRGDYIISFFGSYGGHLVLNNHIRVRVTEIGITQITFSYMPILGFSEEYMPLSSADEILVSLVSHLRRSGVSTHGIIVSNMQLVYYMPNIASAQATPTYILTLIINDILFNYLFDARTNTFLRYEIIR